MSNFANRLFREWT